MIAADLFTPTITLGSVILTILLGVIALARFFPTHWREVASSAEAELARERARHAEELVECNKEILAKRQEIHELKSQLTAEAAKTDLTALIVTIREAQAKDAEEFHKRQSDLLQALTKGHESRTASIIEAIKSSEAEIMKVLEAIASHLPKENT